MDPQRGDLVSSALGTNHAQTTLSPPLPETTAEGADREIFAEKPGLVNINGGGPNHKGKVISKARITGVVVGDILGVASQCVEAEATGGVDIAKPDSTLPGENSTNCWSGDHVEGWPLNRSSSGRNGVLCARRRLRI